MIPVLYPSTETAFTTNGLGGLPDAISCVVTEQRNTQGGYYLEMEYPVDGLHYDLLAPERIIYAAPSMGNTPQPFRISRITRPINGIVHIEAPHISAQLQKITTSGTFTARSFTGITYDYAEAARDLGQTFPFWFSSDKTFTETQINFPEPTPFANVLLGAEGSILDTFGGEYEWNGREVILHDSRGVDSGLEIRYGVNMSDLEAETDATELVTACVPFWKGTVNEQDVIVMGDMCTADNASAYAYVRCVPLDVSQQFDLEQDEQPTAAQVTAKGQAFINSTSRKLLQTSIRVSYEPTTSGIGERLINLCDTVRVVYPDLAVSSISKVVETRFNVLIERYDELTIGTIRNNIVDTIAGLISGGATYSGGGSGSGGGGSAVGAVLYNMPQNLNEAQKAQARQNIGITDEPEEQEYEVIDFIESDGASYINTGILPTADLKVVVKVQHASVDSIASVARQYVLGTYSRDGNDAVVGRYQFYYSGSDTNGDSFFGWGNGGNGVGYRYLPLTADTADHTAIINNGNFRFDGTGYVTLENPVFTAQNPIYLFALNENGTANYYSNGLRIKSVEFSRNGETVANFVPRMRTADGELGMLETVSNVFYTNDGTGQFRNDTAPSEYPYMVVVRPEQFGAKGDGVTDDTLAIQAALDAASDNGTVIFGKKKTYLVSRRDDDIKYTYATPRPRMTKYMLKISGSVTLLGQGATIAYKNPITQQEYDDEYTILYGGDGVAAHPQDAKSATMLYLDNSDKTASSGAVDLNERHSVIIRNLILDGGMATNGVDRSSALTRVGAGATVGNWKAIWAHGTLGMYLELDSVVVKEFACEGVFGLYDQGGKIKAFGCTFTNCMPSAFNIHGSLAECFGCTFNQTEPYIQGSEYAAEMNIFDSCTFNIGSGLAALMAQNNSFDHQLVVRNCIFNRTSHAADDPITDKQRNIIDARYGSNVIVDSCIFNDEKMNNGGQAVVDTHSFAVGQVSNCVFNRPSIPGSDVFYTVRAKDGFSNIVQVSSFSSGGSVRGRGNIIKLNGLKEYVLSEITQPKTITIIPATDDTVFEGYGFGNGNNFITVNKTVYAHLPIKINIDYMSIGRLNYDIYRDTVPNFRVVCSGHPTGTYNVWAEGTTYQNGDRVHYPTATDPVYECATNDNENPPAGEGSGGWYEVGAFNLIIET